MIEHADRPLLLVGAGANRKLTSRSLRMFIDKTGLPFVTTQMGKGFLCENDPLFLGNTVLSSGDFVHRVVDAADLIINIGHDVVGTPPLFMAPNGVKVIHANFSSAKVDPVYFPQLEVVGDIANAIWKISEGIQTQSHWDLHRFMAICGDGGFMMNSKQLETAVRLNLQLVVLILRDDAYWMINCKQSNMGLNEFGLDYGNPEFVKYAES